MIDKKKIIMLINKQLCLMWKDIVKNALEPECTDNEIAWGQINVDYEAFICNPKDLTGYTLRELYRLRDALDTVQKYEGEGEVLVTLSQSDVQNEIYRRIK